MKGFAIALMTAALGLPTFAHADGFGVSGGVSSLGLGLQLGHKFNDAFGVRANVNGFSYDRSGNESGIEYDATAELRSAGVLADWHPFSGNFRLSAGLYYNGTEIDMDGKPQNGGFEFNGRRYDVTDVGTVKGHVEYENQVAPYVGLGWGTLGGKRGFSFSVDVGVLFTGKPEARLSATCRSALTCDQLQRDTREEERQLQADLEDADIYPVLSIGLGYTF